MKPERILILGAYGLLGPVLSDALIEAGHRVARQGRRSAAEVSLDPCDTGALASAVAEREITVIINLVALTDVDRCERVPAEAFSANAAVVRAAADVVLTARGAPRLIQISSDQVYDGPGPHGEEAPRPINVYGITKYAGELEAARAGATILRTNLVGRSRTAGRDGLSDWIVRTLRAGAPMTVYDNILFNPLHLSTLCRCIAHCVTQPHAGVFNLGARSGISKAQFAVRLARALGLPTAAMHIGAFENPPDRARRPLDMTTDVRRWTATFGVPLPDITDEIALVAGDYAA